MGILNLTPDSFSDGGDFIDVETAVRHGQRMVDEGADILDLGGESTRPGAEDVDTEEEIARVLPVLTRLINSLPDHVTISIDTKKAAVAERALEHGASIINDVSAGADPGMFALADAFRVPIILMHMQGTPKTMQEAPTYADPVREVKEFLLERASAAQSSGVSPSQIILDPGIGFGKRRQDNLDLVANLTEFTASGYPVLLGTSRKRFMGSICDETDFKQLLGATCATTALGVFAGVEYFRVHDVKANRQAADVAVALKRSQRA